MRVTVMEDAAVAGAGAVLAERGGQKIIVMDPGLSPAEKDALLRELLEE